jgi:hypothetical protein
VIFVAGVAVVVYVVALPASQYLIDHGEEIADEADYLLDECARIVEQAFQRPRLQPLGDPFVPPIGLPQRESQRRRQGVRNVLVVGESLAGDFEYSRNLAALHADWDITGAAFGESNTQDLYLPTNPPPDNLTLRINVDATRLQYGWITSARPYDAIVFNAPKHESGSREATNLLVDNVLASALHVLKPGGQMRFSGTPAMPGMKHLDDLYRAKTAPGYQAVNRLGYLADLDFGVPYSVRDLHGNVLTRNPGIMNWYVFTK